MTTMRTKHTTQTKVKMGLEAIKGDKTSSEITSSYGVHITQINTWKKLALAVIPDAFSSKIKKKSDEQQELVDQLYRQIGQLKVENDFLKKSTQLNDGGAKAMASS